MIRFTLTDTGEIAAHGHLGERPITPAEAEQIREALEAKRLPWWLDYGAIALVIVAAFVMLRGGGS